MEPSVTRCTVTGSAPQGPGRCSDGCFGVLGAVTAQNATQCPSLSAQWEIHRPRVSWEGPGLGPNLPWNRRGPGPFPSCPSGRATGQQGTFGAHSAGSSERWVFWFL